MTLPGLLRRAERGFKEWDRVREGLLRDGREVTRQAAALIRAWHRDAVTAPARRALDARVASILRAIARQPEFRHAGFVQQALGEFVEAELLLDPSAARALLARLPGDALILGLADAIGELRRRTADRLLTGRLGDAEAAFDRMERLFALLQDADAPDALVPVRAKRDQARGILERTRSDLVTAKKSKELEKKIDKLGDLLDEAEGRSRVKKKAKVADDLDLDSAWSKS